MVFPQIYWRSLHKIIENLQLKEANIHLEYKTTHWDYLKVTVIHFWRTKIFIRNKLKALKLSLNLNNGDMLLLLRIFQSVAVIDEFSESIGALFVYNFPQLHYFPQIIELGNNHYFGLNDLEDWMFPSLEYPYLWLQVYCSDGARGPLGSQIIKNMLIYLDKLFLS